MTTRKNKVIASQFSIATEAVFTPEIAAFNALMKLSKREGDIVMCLVRNVTNSDEIAQTLSISTHTVNNHLKSIFEKTTSKSKTEVLASFLGYAAEQLASREKIMRRPGVLIVGRNEVSCESLAAPLTDQGLKLHTLTNPQLIQEFLGKYPIDCVICDMDLGRSNGMTVLREVREHHASWPHFILGTTSGATLPSLEEAMHEGVSALMPFPIDAEWLVKTLRNLVTDWDLQDRRPRDKTQPVLTLDGTQGEKFEAHIGFGGVLITLATQAATLAQLGIGSLVDLTLVPPGLEGVSLQARGQVVWKRSIESRGLPSGVGIRFVAMSSHDQKIFDRYLQDRQVRSFIPMEPLQDVPQNVSNLSRPLPSTGS